MAGDKFLFLNSGIVTEKALNQTSAGAGDAGKGVALNSAGLIDDTMLPTVETVVAPSTENLAAGDWVNIYDNAAVLSVRKADASGGVGKRAHGFVKAAVTSPANATVYTSGTNSNDSGLTIGVTHYLSATPGAATATPPSTAAHIVQELGLALSATSMATRLGGTIVRS
jgi:hypothetical protein